MTLEDDEFLVIGGESSLLLDSAIEDDPVESFLPTTAGAFRTARYLCRRQSSQV